jgi:hypothetical protein
MINKDNFKGLKNLISLEISGNNLTRIHNETFIYLEKLENLHLGSNRIDLIETNAFFNLNKLIVLNISQNKLKKLDINYLTQLKHLELDSNEFESIKMNSFNLLVNLKTLNLKSNSINRLENNSFNGLLKLKEINLLNNQIIEIDSNAFNNTNFKLLKVSIRNLSVEMMNYLIYRLKPNFVKKSWIYEFYDTIYVENRIDLDCFKTLHLFKFKICYNFLNENVDINDFNCLNLTQVRNTLNEFNDTVFHKNYISNVIFPKNTTYRIIIWTVFVLIGFIVFLAFIYQINLFNKLHKIIELSFFNVRMVIRRIW